MAVLVRLRPIVHASPTGTGLHVRGRASSFTIDGGSGLWTVWQRLSRHLADGIPPAELTPRAGTSPAVGAAVEAILAQLREHDMLVEVPADWGADAPAPAIAGWLESVAADPQLAWRRLRQCTIAITGGGVLAAAARRAVTSAGLAADDVISEDDGLVVTTGDHAVAAGCAANVGWVVHPGAPADVRANSRAVAARLAADGPSAPEVLAALVASAAVHRLICAAGGLPDPSTEQVPAPTTTDGCPNVLVARLDPLRAAYHPWLSSAHPAQLTVDPLRAMDILNDGELGPVPTVALGALPQVPAHLARCGDVLGIGTTVNAARLDAAIGALRARLPAGTAVGIGPAQALGCALRQLVRHLPSGESVPEPEWVTDPTARRWWKALTLRFAVPATIDVRRLAPRVVRAEILSPQGLLAWSVEASAADAVAFAALAATGHVQAGEGGAARHLNAAIQASVGDSQPSQPREWHWPAGLGEYEPQLQADLVALAGGRPRRVPLEARLESVGVVAFEGRFR